MGVWVAQPGWVPACWKSGRCERMEKHPEGTGLPPWPGSSALFSGNPSILGWRRGLRLTFLWAPVSWGKRSAGLIVVVAPVALSHSPAEEGAAMGSSHIDAKLGTCLSLPHTPLRCQLHEGKGPCLIC